MAKKAMQILVPDEVIMSKIYLIRGLKVILDKDLAELYQVETKQLKRSVRRNIARFPRDFMFELNSQELSDLRSHFGTSSWGGTRYLPMAFTEHGILMLASILGSDRAIQMNIQIVRIFIRMREMLSSHEEILRKLEKMDEIIAGHNNQILLIFEYLKQLEASKEMELERKIRKRIGFRTHGSPED